MGKFSKILLALAVLSSPGFARLYVGIEGGDSISTNTHFQPDITFPRETVFEVSTPQNTDWSRDIGSAGLVGVFIGYGCNPNLALQFDYTYRSGYDWNVLTLEEGGVFDRYRADTIRIHTFLFDLILRPCTNCCAFDPYIKIGIGVARNRIDGIQNIEDPAADEPLTFNSQITGNTSTNFAWDVGVGADYRICRNLSFGVGYRFVDTGRLRSGSDFTDSVSGLTSTISPFSTRHVYLNEVIACLTYHFDCI